MTDEDREHGHAELDKGPHPLIVRAQELFARVMQLKPVRVFTLYGARRGPLLSAGMSFQAVFAVFAAIWVTFSVAGLVLRANPDLSDALLDLLGNAVPGLIDDGNGGAIDPQDLFDVGALTWIGAIGLVGTLLTAIGWLDFARNAVRDIAQLAAPPTLFLLLKVKDLGLAIAFGALLIISAAISVGSTAALTTVFSWWDMDRDSVGTVVAVRVVGLALTFAIDTGVLVALYRVLAGVPIPWKPLIQGSLLAAAALGILKVLGSTLLGNASSNPLLASFAVIIGLLLWFNLICQVILIGAAWVVVSATDAGVPLDPIGERERRENEARLRLEVEDEVRAEIEAGLPRAVRFLVRRTQRRKVTRQN